MDCAPNLKPPPSKKLVHGIVKNLDPITTSWPSGAAAFAHLNMDSCQFVAPTVPVYSQPGEECVLSTFRI